MYPRDLRIVTKSQWIAWQRPVAWYTWTMVFHSQYPSNDYPTYVGSLSELQRNQGVKRSQGEWFSQHDLGHPCPLYSTQCIDGSLLRGCHNNQCIAMAPTCWNLYQWPITPRARFSWLLLRFCFNHQFCEVSVLFLFYHSVPNTSQSLTLMANGIVTQRFELMTLSTLVTYSLWNNFRFAEEERSKQQLELQRAARRIRDEIDSKVDEGVAMLDQSHGEAIDHITELCRDRDSNRRQLDTLKEVRFVRCTFLT